MSWGVQELALEAPIWLALTPLVVALWWFASRSGGASERATGALELWRELAGAAPRALRREWRFSPRATWIAGALVSALLGLAQPTSSVRESPTRWRVIVDAGPGMCVADSSARSRGAAALERARQMLESVSQRSDSVEWWLVSGGEALEQRAEFPSDWPLAEQARWGLPAPDWARFDAAGTLWVRDRAQGTAPRFAGLCASPRAPADGAVAGWPGMRLALRAGELVVEPTRRPRVRLSPALASGVLERAVTAWARARGVDLARADDGDGFELRVTAIEHGERVQRSGMRDGWRLSGSAAARLEPRAGDSIWLSDERDPSVALIRSRRGSIECALDARAQLVGDEAGFAVAWAQLLDECLLPVDALAPLEAREGFDDALERPPLAGRALGTSAQRWGHVFLLLAALCVLVALFARA